MLPLVVAFCVGCTELLCLEAAALTKSTVHLLICQQAHLLLVFSSGLLNGVALKSQHTQPSDLVSLPQLTLVTAERTLCHDAHMVLISVNPWGEFHCNHAWLHSWFLLESSINQINGLITAGKHSVWVVGTGKYARMVSQLQLLLCTGNEPLLPPLISSATGCVWPVSKGVVPLSGWGLRWVALLGRIWLLAPSQVGVCIQFCWITNQKNSCEVIVIVLECYAMLCYVWN